MGTQPPPQKGAEPPIFGPCLLRRWPWPSRRHCVRWGPSYHLS